MAPEQPEHVIPTPGVGFRFLVHLHEFRWPSNFTDLDIETLPESETQNKREALKAIDSTVEANTQSEATQELF